MLIALAKRCSYIDGGAPASRCWFGRDSCKGLLLSVTLACHLYILMKHSLMYTAKERETPGDREGLIEGLLLLLLWLFEPPDRSGAGPHFLVSWHWKRPCRVPRLQQLSSY